MLFCLDRVYGKQGLFFFTRFTVRSISECPAFVFGWDATDTCVISEGQMGPQEAGGR